MVAARRDVYEQTTARIVAALEAGVVPWVRPWSINGCHDGPEQNALTARPYNGANVILLWLTRQERGYFSPRWLTFRQALQLGGHVRRGERGTTVVFWSAATVPDERDDEADEKRVVWAKAYTLFNVEQCADLPEKIIAANSDGSVPDDGTGRIERCESFMTATGAAIRYGGDEACYRPGTDTIQMPPFANFEAPAHFYATAFHELVHWSGHETRCDRKLGKRFGPNAYAVEELVAELGSAFLCDRMEIPGQLRHASYIDHWLGVLRSDKRAIFAAASKARAAVEFLLDETPMNKAAA